MCSSGNIDVRNLAHLFESRCIMHMIHWWKHCGPFMAL